MTGSKHIIITTRQDPDLVSRSQKRIGAHWPEFMLHDPTAQLLADCYEHVPDFQFVLVPEGGGEAMAIGNSIPLAWKGRPEELPEDGWDWALRRGIEDLDAGREARILCALQIVVFDEYRSSGISGEVVAAMKGLGAQAGLQGMIAPVRPSRKAEFPREDIEDYIRRKDAQGLPFDPWLRVHCRLGARIIRPCRNSMRISGTVAEWESWTGMSFPESGSYEVPGALVPVQIDRERDLGLYIEPNVWMYHSPAGG